MKRGRNETQKQREVRRKGRTLPKYNPEIVRKVKQAAKAPAAPAPSDPDEFIDWLTG